MYKIFNKDKLGGLITDEYTVNDLVTDLRNAGCKKANYQIVKSWLAGETQPNLTYALALTKLFKKPIEYFTGE